jgi:hypothetical protein
LRGFVRKFVAIAALLALLLPCVSALAGTLSAASLPACCNSVYCPLHHNQGHGLQGGKSDCGGMGVPGKNGCSMRSCDAAPNPTIVGTAAFLLVAPYAIHVLTFAEAAPNASSQFLPYVVMVPAPPPPRTLLS